jgi:hypothetical protein
MRPAAADPMLAGMSLRRLAALVALAALAVGVGTASARDPRLEQQRLTPADMRLARGAVLKRGDLATGWRSLAVPSADGERLSCPGFDPDFSRFTITGRAVAAFAHPDGVSVTTAVEVYRSRGDAAGDFRVGTQPGVVRCLRKVLADAFAAGGAVPLRVRSARRVAAPRVGDRTAAYRVVASLDANGTPVPLYLDVLVFGRGRSLATLMAVSAYHSLGDRTLLARTMAARMR